MKFRLGDKVLIYDCEGDKSYNGKIGIIIDVDRIKRFNSIWDYLCSFKGKMNYVFGPPEMTKVIIKGQQLLFDFME